MIRRHGRLLEADLRREYGVRLRDLTHGDLTYRELASLVAGLPPGSITRAALRGGRPEATGEQILLADVYDVMTALDWHFITANGDEKKGKPKPPKPYPRWWLLPKGTKSPERIAKIEDARRRKRAREQAIAEGRIA